MSELTEKQIKTREKYSKKRSTTDKVYIITMIIVCVASIISFNKYITKANNSINDYSVVFCPIQEDIDDKSPFNFNINGKNIVMQKVATYQVAGRVVETYDYTTGIAGIVKTITGKEYYNQISCKDIAISYGALVPSENHNKMNYSMFGTRKVSYYVKDRSIFDTFSSMDELERYITNNHIIPANDKVNELIKNVSKDDFIQLTGYLVNVSWSEGIYHYSLESSLSRDDTGNGACEVLLVEDVKWIK